MLPLPLPGTSHRSSLTREPPCVGLIHGCRRARTQGCHHAEAKIHGCSNTRTHASSGRTHACSGKTHACSGRIPAFSAKIHGSNERTHAALTPGMRIAPFRIRIRTLAEGARILGTRILGKRLERIPVSPEKTRGWPHVKTRAQPHATTHVTVHVTTHVWPHVTTHAWRAQRTYPGSEAKPDLRFRDKLLKIHGCTILRHTTTSTAATARTVNQRTPTCCRGRTDLLHGPPDLPRCQRKDLPQSTLRIRWRRCILASRKTKTLVDVPGRRAEKAAGRDDPRQTKAWVALAILAALIPETGCRATGAQATGARHMPEDLASHLRPVDRQLMLPEAAKEPSVAPVLAAALAPAAVPSSPTMACSPAQGQESQTSALLATHLEWIHEVAQQAQHPAQHQEAADTRKAGTRRQPTHGNQHKEDETAAAAVEAATRSSALSSVATMAEAEEGAATLSRVTAMVEANLMVSRLAPAAQRNGHRRSPVGLAHCVSQSTKTKRGLLGRRGYRSGRGGSHN